MNKGYKEYTFESYVYMGGDDTFEVPVFVTFEVNCDDQIEIVCISKEEQGDNIVDDVSDYDMDRLIDEAAEFYADIVMGSL